MGGVPMPHASTTISDPRPEQGVNTHKSSGQVPTTERRAAAARLFPAALAARDTSTEAASPRKTPVNDLEAVTGPEPTVNECAPEITTTAYVYRQAAAATRP